jgi:hypothetical protein
MLQLIATELPISTQWFMQDGARPQTQLMWYFIFYMKSLVPEWFLIVFLDAMIVDRSGHSTVQTLISVIFFCAASWRKNCAHGNLVH